MSDRSNLPGAEIVVLADGDAPPTGLSFSVAPLAVIAADGGARHAAHLGLTVTHLVGDFDSIKPSLLDALTRDGANLQRHPVEKDESDLELALRLAVTIPLPHLDHGARPRVLVIGASGGRVDHAAVNLAVICGASTESVSTTALLGETLLSVVRPGHEVTVVGQPGDIVTLLAVQTRATGVRTSGLAYALADDVLEPGSSRGLSNELVASHASVRVASGTIAAFQPHFLVTDNPRNTP